MGDRIAHSCSFGHCDYLKRLRSVLCRMKVSVTISGGTVVRNNHGLSQCCLRNAPDKGNFPFGGMVLDNEFTRQAAELRYFVFQCSDLLFDVVVEILRLPAMHHHQLVAVDYDILWHVLGMPHRSRKRNNGFVSRNYSGPLAKQQATRVPMEPCLNSMP